MSPYAMYQHDFQFTSPGGRVTQAVQRLILVSAAVFAVQLALDIPFGRFPGMLPGGGVTELFAFEGRRLFSGWIWTPFTYMFIHTGLMHLFMNMLWLFVFGPDVERLLGTRQFYRFYVFCGAVGVLATLFSFLLSGKLTLVAGASGAVMGVLVAFAMAYPERRFFFFPLPIPLTAKTLGFIVVALNMVSALGDARTSVATHFGGMAAGYAYMKAAQAIRDHRRRAREDEEPADPVGDAVNNIFKFDEKRRKRP